MSADGAAIWAHAALGAKNRLVATDAKFVEVAFQHQLADVASSETAELANDPAPTPQVDVASADEKPSQRQDGSRAASRHRQERNCHHSAAIATGSTFAMLPSGRVSSAAAESDPHHLRYLQPRALGRKVSDEFAVA